MAERKDLQAFKGNPLTLTGNPIPEVGKSAPDFTVYKSLTDPMTLSELRGKVVVLSSVPSLDTPVCANQTNRFNKEAGALGDDVVILTVSMDLPMAQSRWCGANSATGIKTASDYRDREFGEKYGLRVKELGLLARAVFVVDREGIIRHMEICKELSEEPDYNAALAVVRSLV